MERFEFQADGETMYQIFDRLTGKTYNDLHLEEICNLLNELSEKI